MRTRTNEFKNQIKEMGRQIDSRITLDNNTEIYGDELFSIYPILNTDILKSVMKALKVESSVELQIGDRFKYEFGLLVGSSYEWIDFGYYYVREKEYNEDTKNWNYVCYDKMLRSMIEYKGVQSAEFPMTVRDYISSLLEDLDIIFIDYNSVFPNYDKVIEKDLYVDDNGNSLGYTYRDILDELSAVVAGNIMVNNNEEGFIKYPPSNEVSKNILDMDEGFRNGYINTSGNFVSQNVTAVFNQDIEVEAGQTYCFSTNASVDNLVVSMFRSNNTYKSRTKVTNTDRIVQLIPSDVAYVNFSINKDNSVTMTQSILNSLQPMVEKNNTRTDYEPHITFDTIDEEYFKDINVKFGEKFGPLNTVILLRSADSDGIYKTYPENLPEQDRIAIQIVDNQIMNGNDRADYCEEILNKLKGLEFYLNDFKSTGILVYEALDMYYAYIDGNYYKCLMLNDEPKIDQGLEERIYTDLPDEVVKKYTNMSDDDRKINQVYIIAKKNEGLIEAVVESQNNIESKVSRAEATLTEQGATLEVITKNIDTTTGDITALKRTSYELGENGLIIDDEQGYKSVSNTTGQYYYDGNTMVGKYTKDGSVQKDMALFGKYYYGIDEDLDVENFTKDDAMFMAQLYEDNNGDEAFGDFYNGR